MIRKPIQLEQALNILIDDLVKKGILKDVNKDDLIQKTVDHIKQTWGEVPTSEEIKNPVMLTKLSLAVVATNTLPDPKAKSLIKNTHTQVNDVQLKRLTEELVDTLKLKNPEGAQPFLIVLLVLSKEADKSLKDNPAPKPAPSVTSAAAAAPSGEQADNTFAAEYSADGTCINVLEEVCLGKKAGIITREGEKALGADMQYDDILTMATDLINEFNRFETSPRLQPGQV